MLNPELGALISRRRPYLINLIYLSRNNFLKNCPGFLYITYHTTYLQFPFFFDEATL